MIDGFAETSPNLLNAVSLSTSIQPFSFQFAVRIWPQKYKKPSALHLAGSLIHARRIETSSLAF